MVVISMLKDVKVKTSHVSSYALKRGNRRNSKTGQGKDLSLVSLTNTDEKINVGLYKNK